MVQKSVLRRWSQTAKLWRDVKPTLKPSAVEVELYEKFLRQILKKIKREALRVLVLGATPEIRDLLARYKLAVTLLDANPRMMTAMHTLIKIKNHRERAIVGNWLKMPLTANSFDLVMSDHPTSSIAYQQLPKFFAEINRVLKPGGHIIIDFHLNAHVRPLTVDGYLAAYRKNRTWFANFDNHTLLYYRVIMGEKRFYNPKTYRSQWGKLDRQLRYRCEAGKLTKNEYEHLVMGLGEDHIFNFYPKKVLKEFVGASFKILNEPPIKAHPVYQYYWPCFARSLKKH